MFTKVDTNALLESNLFSNTPCVVDPKSRKLLGRYVGNVEVIEDAYRVEDGWDYVTEYYLAYQLVTGPIIAVESIPNGKDPDKIISLKGKAFIINWGWYPVDFPSEWEGYHTAPAAPIQLTQEEMDNLPF